MCNGIFKSSANASKTRKNDSSFRRLCFRVFFPPPPPPPPPLPSTATVTKCQHTARPLSYPSNFFFAMLFFFFFAKQEGGGGSLPDFDRRRRRRRLPPPYIDSIRECAREGKEEEAANAALAQHQSLRGPRVGAFILVVPFVRVSILILLLPAMRHHVVVLVPRGHGVKKTWMVFTRNRQFGRR